MQFYIIQFQKYLQRVIIISCHTNLLQNYSLFKCQKSIIIHFYLYNTFKKYIQHVFKNLGDQIFSNFDIFNITNNLFSYSILHCYFNNTIVTRYQNPVLLVEINECNEISALFTIYTGYSQIKSKYLYLFLYKIVQISKQVIIIVQSLI